MPLPCHVEPQSFLRAGGQLMEISTPVVRPTPTWDRAPEYNQPKDTEPGSGSGSRSIYNALSQSWPVLGSELRKPLALVSGATGICIWEKGDRSPGSPPVPTTAVHLSHSHPNFVHSFWFGV